MITINVEQGSPEWLNARAGVVTASMFEVARDKLKSGSRKGQPTKIAENYAFQLAVERVSNEPLDGSKFENWAMRRGRELEPEARAKHTERTGLHVTEVGLVLTDDSLFGASADGFIGDDIGCEYKCYTAPEKLRSIILNEDFSDVMAQIQGGLWITGRKTWHFCLYCPALSPIGKDFVVHEVNRDEDYISELEADLLEFNALIDVYGRELKNSGAGNVADLAGVF